MLTKIKELLNKTGINEAIFYTSLARLIQGGGGLIVVILVTQRLTSIEQGYYFTFTSILAIQLFFELGLNNILNQYVAHEIVQTQFSNEKLTGNKVAISRINSLLHFSIKIYAILSLCLLIILLLSGIFFFSYFSNNKGIEWKYPWILVSFTTTLYFLISPINAFLQGLGKVKEMAFMQFLQQSIAITSLICSLLLGAKLYAGGIALFANILVCILFIHIKFRKTLKYIYKTPITDRISYKKEIFPYQWKIAISWISSYFIFQLFNPVLFATEGAIIAGKMGITLSVLNAIMSLSDSWITTKIPLFSGLISKHNYTKLDSLFNLTLRQAFFVNLTILSIFLCILYIIDINNFSISGELLIKRFLPYTLIIMLMFTIILRQLYSGWAIYLRCHKKEPLLLQSVIMGGMCAISTFILGHMYGVMGLVIGYTVLTIITTIWTYRVYTIKKKEWHHAIK